MKRGPELPSCTDVRASTARQRSAARQPRHSAQKRALAAQPSAELAIERLRSDMPSPLLGHPPSPTVDLQGTASKGFAAADAAGGVGRGGSTEWV